MGYYFYFPPKNKIIVLRYDKFFEKNLISQEASGMALDIEDTSPSKNAREHQVEAESLKPQFDVSHIHRPDVVFTQNITSRFQQNLGEKHWTTMKNILKYLRNTGDMLLVYDENLEAELRVTLYCVAGFENDKDDIKSQAGYVFVLNGGTVD
nr:hypothetical protein [Tanacetum cinerariifolium]